MRRNCRCVREKGARRRTEGRRRVRRGAKPRPGGRDRLRVVQGLILLLVLANRSKRAAGLDAQRRCRLAQTWPLLVQARKRGRVRCLPRRRQLELAQARPSRRSRVAVGDVLAARVEPGRGRGRVGSPLRRLVSRLRRRVERLPERRELEKGAVGAERRAVIGVLPGRKAVRRRRGETFVRRRRALARAPPTLLRTVAGLANDLRELRRVAANEKPGRVAGRTQTSESVEIQTRVSPSHAAATDAPEENVARVRVATLR